MDVEKSNKPKRTKELQEAIDMLASKERIVLVLSSGGEMSMAYTALSHGHADLILRYIDLLEKTVSCRP